MTKLKDRARRLAEAKVLADEVGKYTRGMIELFGGDPGTYPLPAIAEALASIALSLSVIADALWLR